MPCPAPEAETAADVSWPRTSGCCGTVRDVELSWLLVVDPDGGHELVGLPHPPEDPTNVAELVAVLGAERHVEPAGPPLRAPGHVVHRVRGRVTGPGSSVPDELAPLVSAALEQERGGPAPWTRPPFRAPSRVQVALRSSVASSSRTALRVAGEPVTASSGAPDRRSVRQASWS